MEKITIIQLLNKIANGEAVPKDIKFDGELCSFDNEDKDYYCEQYGNIVWYLVDTRNNMSEVLDTEVEILDEEDEFEDIEEFEPSEYVDLDNDKKLDYLYEMTRYLIKNQKKIIERLQHENSKDNV